MDEFENINDNTLDSKTSADYNGFSLINGGLTYSLTSIIRKKSKAEKGSRNTAIALAIITWLPLCLLALYYGTLDDDDTTISFFEDFVVHVRFLIVVPFLVLIENSVNKTFVEYIKNTDNIIPNIQQQDYNKMVDHLKKITTSYLPEIIVLIVYLTALFMNPDLLASEDAHRNYMTYTGTNTLNIAGWYNFLISIPIFLLLMFRWFYRWVIWFYSIIKISNFNIYVDPLHADKMAGLSYLNLVPITFSFIIVAPAAVMSAKIGMDIIYNGASFKSFSYQILFYIIASPIILYSPLLAFMGKLSLARRKGILIFGDLVRKHDHDYVKKWLDPNSKNEEPVLGAVDNSSLADINGSYAPIEGLQMVPIDFKMILASFVMNAIPYVPLVFTYYSFKELFTIIMKAMIGI